MLRKAIAALLLLLAASPFTAPFATCDVATLFGDHSQIVQTQASFESTAEDQSALNTICAVSKRIRIGFKVLSHTDVGARVDASARHRADTPPPASAALPLALDLTSFTALRI